jgi:adenylate cyclase
VSAVDFEREGLLDGVDSKQERAARVKLLQQLIAEGVSLEDLRQAASEDRLALLPVELVFTRDCQYSIGEVAEKVGLSEEFLRRDQLALGLPQPDREEQFFSEADIEGAMTVRQLLDAGVSEEDLLELARVTGQGAARLAETVLGILAPLFMRAGDTERDLGLRYADVAMRLAPLIGPSLETPLRQHIREVIRREVLGRAERAMGRLPGSREVTVCFADLVGFTSLGEALDVAAIGDVARRLEAMAAVVATPPVRLVKMIGDAAMLVSTDASALLTAALALVETAERAEGEFPRLRAGVAMGPAQWRSGDWYGRPVNLASRITDVADPGCVVATRDVRDAVGHGGHHWSPAQARTFKGIDGVVQLFRLNRTDPLARSAG